MLLWQVKSKKQQGQHDVDDLARSAHYAMDSRKEPSSTPSGSLESRHYRVAAHHISADPEHYQHVVANQVAYHCDHQGPAVAGDQGLYPTTRVSLESITVISLGLEKRINEFV